MNPLLSRTVASIAPAWPRHAVKLVRFTRSWALRIASIIVCLFLWQQASTQGWHTIIQFQNVPASTEVAQATLRIAQSPKVLSHVVNSLRRIFLGFSLAAVVAIGLGLVIGRFRLASDALMPPLEILRPIPAVAWIPLAILMFTSAEHSMVYITFIGAFFPILLNAIHGVQGVDRRLIFASMTLGAGPVTVFREVILPGEFVAILGPSGCGKSTLLGAVAGFTPLSVGKIVMDGEAVRKPSAERGVVFQHHTLFPWKTVLGNTEFGLKMRGLRKVERRERARDILQRVGLAESERRYPEQLSGGMQQRVNLARVLVNRPRVLLMDEPFSALDAQTRLQMQELLLELWQELRMTVIFVTHDIDEAIFLSDRLVILSRRPGELIAEMRTGLERPRTAELLTSPGFMSLKRECMERLRNPERQRLSMPSRPRIRTLSRESASDGRATMPEITGLCDGFGTFRT